MDLSIPTAQKIVLLALLRHRNGVSGLCFPGVALLGQMTGLGKTWTHRVLRELELAGYVTVEAIGGGKGRKTNYALTLPQYAAGNAPGCAPANGSLTERFTRPNGSLNGSLQVPKSDLQNNKVLNTYEHSLTRRLPPQREKRGKFGRVLENLERARRRRAGAGT